MMVVFLTALYRANTDHLKEIFTIIINFILFKNTAEINSNKNILTKEFQNGIKLKINYDSYQ